MNSIDEIYPIPMYNSLGVSDITWSVERYQDALDFESIFEMPIFLHLRCRKNADNLFVPSEIDIEPKRQDRGVTFCLTAKDESVAEIADQAHAAGPYVSGSTETMHNTREVTITDPGEYSPACSEPADTTRRFEDVMRVKYEAATKQFK